MTLINQLSQCFCLFFFFTDFTNKVTRINHKTNHIYSPITAQHVEGTKQNGMESWSGKFNDCVSWESPPPPPPWPLTHPATGWQQLSCPAQCKNRKTHQSHQKNKMAYHHFLCPACWWQMCDDPVGNSVSLSVVRGTRSLVFACSSPSPASLSSIFSTATPLKIPQLWLISKVCAVRRLADSIPWVRATMQRGLITDTLEEDTVPSKGKLKSKLWLLLPFLSGPNNH